MTLAGSSGRALLTGVGTLALLVGGAGAQLAATAPLAWGMVLGSGVELAGGTWLMNLTEAMVALGAIAGGWLMDRGRHGLTVLAASTALAGGLGLAWAWPEEPAAVLLGLAGLASGGSGLLLAVVVVVVVGGSSRGRGLWGGVVLAGGLVLTESVWGGASMLALSQGAVWVIGRTGLIASGAAIAGGGLLLLALRWGWWGSRWPAEAGRAGTFPAVAWGERAADSATFWLLAAVALLAAFAGLVAQRAGAALSLLGLPEGSFASGVLVGHSFALCRIAGVLVGGLVFELFGPRATYRVAAGLLAGALTVLSLHTGYENPWRPLIGAVGVACGLAAVVVPLGAAQLLGPRHLGFHFGYLYLATVVGAVMVVPATSLVASQPQGALWGTALVALVLAGLTGRLGQAPAGS